MDTPRIELAKIHLAAAAAEGSVCRGQRGAGGLDCHSRGGARRDGFRLGRSWIPRPPRSRSRRRCIQRDAVLNRLDVRRALAQYAAAEADLQLEIAKQYPDLQIGPGYTYEEGNSFFTLGLSATLPVFNRNQGPIAEAEARRRQAAAAFLREADAGDRRERNQPGALHLRRCSELAEADRSLRTLRAVATAIAQRAVQVGEQDRLALNGVRDRSMPCWPADASMRWRARRARWANWKTRCSARSTPAMRFPPARG